MSSPTVSFIVPCYKLAHLLPECINSILAQSYSDFEVLIMDDCSPDSTPEVARSFGDPRVKHIRNEPNLGHLRNYNEGIRLSKGEYVWLISADDYLLSHNVLEKFVELMESNPKIGYCFCPGYGVGVNFDTQVMGRYSLRDDRDRILMGHLLLKRLLRSNFILAAAGLVRRECYEKVSLFPLDLPYAGDWYLWSVFALHFDVGYFSEPMVCYRKHELSMTNALFQKRAEVCCEEDVGVLWRVKQRAQECGMAKMSRAGLDALGEVYARNIAVSRYGMSTPSLTFDEFEKSLATHSENEAECSRIRARVLAGMGNEYYWQGKWESAKMYYLKAIKRDPLLFPVYLKLLLLSVGKRGQSLRKAILSLRS